MLLKTDVFLREASARKVEFIKALTQFLNCTLKRSFTDSWTKLLQSTRESDYSTTLYPYHYLEELLKSQKNLMTDSKWIAKYMDSMITTKKTLTSGSSSTSGTQLISNLKTSSRKRKATKEDSLCGAFTSNQTTITSMYSTTAPSRIPPANVQFSMASLINDDEDENHLLPTRQDFYSITLYFYLQGQRDFYVYTATGSCKRLDRTNDLYVRQAYSRLQGTVETADYEDLCPSELPGPSGIPSSERNLGRKEENQKRPNNNLRCQEERDIEFLKKF